MTLNEIIYIIKEAIKANSDDLSFDYPGELIAAKIGNIRALLVKQRYQDGRKEIPDVFYQKICLTLALVNRNSTVCIGSILKSTDVLPELLTVANRKAVNIIQQGNDIPLKLNYIQLNRLYYTGFNSLVKNQLYVAIDKGNYLYLKGDNKFFKLITALEVYGVLLDPVEAENYTCAEITAPCDIYTEPYPAPEDMIAEIVQIVLKEMLPTINIPEDQENNADESNR